MNASFIKWSATRQFTYIWPRDRISICLSKVSLCDSKSMLLRVSYTWENHVNLKKATKIKHIQTSNKIVNCILTFSKCVTAHLTATTKKF